MKCMKKNLAVCKHKETIAIFNKQEYGTAWDKWEILFETDDFREACAVYKQYYNKQKRQITKR